MEAHSRKIRVGEAALAIQTTPKSLRHWISRHSGKGVKPSTEQTDSWMEFSWGDVAVLAVTKILVDFGLASYDAFEIASTAIKKRFSNLFDDDPAWLFTDENVGLLIICRGRDGHWLSNATNDENWEEGPYSHAVLTLNIERIIAGAFDALVSMGHAAPFERDDRVKIFRTAIHRMRDIAADVSRTIASGLRDIDEQLKAVEEAGDLKELRYMQKECAAFQSDVASGKVFRSVQFKQPSDQAVSDKVATPPSNTEGKSPC